MVCFLTVLAFVDLFGVIESFYLEADILMAFQPKGTHQLKRQFLPEDFCLVTFLSVHFLLCSSSPSEVASGIFTNSRFTLFVNCKRLLHS